jgi:hypothetical protein
MHMGYVLLLSNKQTSIAAAAAGNRHLSISVRMLNGSWRGKEV